MRWALLAALLACEPLTDDPAQQALNEAGVPIDAGADGAAPDAGDAGPDPDADVVTADTGDADAPAPDATPDAAAETIGRINYLTAPTNVEVARASGCVGGNAGTGFARFIESVGGLEPLVRPRDGTLPLVLIAVLNDSLTLTEGWVDAENLFWFDDPPRPWTEFANFARIDDRQVARAETLQATLPTAPAVPLQLRHPEIAARWTRRGAGLQIDAARLVGALDEAAIQALTDALVAACAQAPAPDACDRWPPLRPGSDPAAHRPFVTGLLGGADLRVADGRLAPCTDDCDAVSACLLLSGVPLEVAGARPRE